MALEGSDASIPVYTSLGIAAAEPANCYLVEAKAAFTIVPGFLGTGLALSYDLPVGVELCVSRGPGLEPVGELRAWGPGLTYSTPWLASELARALADAAPLIVGGDSLSIAELSERLKDLVTPELVYASLYGSAATVSGKPFLLDVHGYWLLAIKLDNHVQQLDIPVADAVQAASLALADLEEGLALLTRATLRSIASAGDDNTKRLAYELNTLGFVGIAVDYSGRYLVAIADRYNSVLDALAVAKAHGFLAAYGRLASFYA